MSYGDTFTPAGVQSEIKVRGPIWAGAWSLTGVYAIYWLYVTAKHLSEYGQAKNRDLGQNPTMTLLAFLIGWIIIVPPIVALYRMCKRVQQVQHMNGVQPMNGWLCVVFYLVFSPVLIGYMQSELNKAWAAEGGPVPDQSAEYEAPPLNPAPAAPVAPESPVASAPAAVPTQAPSSGATSGDPLAPGPDSPERP